MMESKTNGNAPTKGGLGLLALLMAFCLLAGGSPVQAQEFGTDNGGPYAAILGGFAVYPALYINSGTVHTRNGKNSIHMFSSIFTFDPVAREASGSGRYSMVVGADTSALSFGRIVQGRWEVTRFVDWEFTGECSFSDACLEGGPFPNPLHPAFTAGKVRVVIHLYDEDDDLVGRALLTVFCSLPGIPYKGGIERYGVRIRSGEFRTLSFQQGSSPTVFVNLSKFP